VIIQPGEGWQSGVPTKDGTRPISFELHNPHEGLTIDVSTGVITLESGIIEEEEVITASIFGANVIGFGMFEDVYTIRTVPPNIPGFKFAGKSDSTFLYLSNSINLSWWEGNTLCNQAGGHMVTISSQEENDLVFNSMGSGHVWIGFTDQVSEGNFVWVTGEAVNYTNWFPGEPSSVGPDDDYTIMTTPGPASGTWSSQFNSVNRYAVILEIDY